MSEPNVPIEFVKDYKPNDAVFVKSGTQGFADEVEERIQNDLAFVVMPTPVGKNNLDELYLVPVEYFKEVS